MPSPTELKTVGDDSCSTLEEEEEELCSTNICHLCFSMNTRLRIKLWLAKLL